MSGKEAAKKSNKQPVILGPVGPSDPAVLERLKRDVETLGPSVDAITTEVTRIINNTTIIGGGGGGTAAAAVRGTVVSYDTGSRTAVVNTDAGSYSDVANLSGFTLTGSDEVELVFEDGNVPVVVGMRRPATVVLPPAFDVPQVPAEYPLSNGHRGPTVDNSTAFHTKHTGGSRGFNSTSLGSFANVAARRLLLVPDGAVFGLSWSGPTLIDLTNVSATDVVRFVSVNNTALNLTVPTTSSAELFTDNTNLYFSTGLYGGVSPQRWNPTTLTWNTVSAPPSGGSTTLSHPVLAQGRLWMAVLTTNVSTSKLFSTPAATPGTWTDHGTIAGTGSANNNVVLHTDGTRLWFYHVNTSGTPGNGLVSWATIGLGTVTWTTNATVVIGSHIQARSHNRIIYAPTTIESAPRSFLRIDTTTGAATTWTNVLPTAANGGPLLINQFLTPYNGDFIIVGGLADRGWVTSGTANGNRIPAIWIVNSGGSQMLWYDPTLPNYATTLNHLSIAVNEMRWVVGMEDQQLIFSAGLNGTTSTSGQAAAGTDVRIWSLTL